MKGSIRETAIHDRNHCYHRHQPTTYHQPPTMGTIAIDDGDAMGAIHDDNQCRGRADTARRNTGRGKGTTGQQQLAWAYRPQLLRMAAATRANPCRSCRRNGCSIDMLAKTGACQRRRCVRSLLAGAARIGRSTACASSSRKCLHAAWPAGRAGIADDNRGR